MKSTSKNVACGLLLGTAVISGNRLIAESYMPPLGSDDLVGQVITTSIQNDDTLPDVARRFNIGRQEIELANPGVSVWLPEPGEEVVIPSRYILPHSHRTGLVLNLPEMRIYHYQHAIDGTVDSVTTYPVSIGQLNWQTPLGTSKIIAKRQNPVWIPPESIRIEAKTEGRILPKVVPAGQNNPLGEYALTLDLPSYLLHGTNKPLGIGLRVTHGCVRLYPEDIEQLFHAVEIGTPIEIINQPVKLGWSNNELYLEVHPPLQEFDVPEYALVEMAVSLLHSAMKERPVTIRSSLVRQTVKNRDGVPVRLSTLVSNQ